MLIWYRGFHRRRLLARPYPDGWESILARNVAHYPLLSAAEQDCLRNGCRILVAEKIWEGCGGLVVTEEMQVTIAAQASLMLLGRDHDYFRRVLSILVYPDTFQLPKDEAQDEGVARVGLVGQAVYRGPVILAWDAVLAEGRDPSTGYNVVIHEFAHQLDFLDGYANGFPDVADADQADRWYAAMSGEYQRLRRDLRGGHETFLGDHAGRNEGEFFAVASERFFTRPARLRHYHPPVYAVLAEYYRVDPITWFAGREVAPSPRE